MLFIAVAGCTPKHPLLPMASLYARHLLIMVLLDSDNGVYSATGYCCCKLMLVYASLSDGHTSECASFFASIPAVSL